MKPSYILAAVVYVLHGVSARNCKKGLDYCGSNLLSIGKYREQVDTALSDAGLTQITNFQRQNSLFSCLGGDNGEISFIKTCPVTCYNAGKDRSDFCRDPSHESAEEAAELDAA